MRVVHEGALSLCFTQVVKALEAEIEDFLGLDIPAVIRHDAPDGVVEFFPADVALPVDRGVGGVLFLFYLIGIGLCKGRRAGVGSGLPPAVAAGGMGFAVTAAAEYRAGLRRRKGRAAWTAVASR